LRLGPFFYYFNYFSALIFGETPASINYLAVFVSILTIILFYGIFRLLFNRFLSLGLTFLTAVSLFMVIYARFSWNPNMLPFFATAFILILVLLYNYPQEPKNIKNPFLKKIYANKKISIALIYFFSIFFALVIQLHFLAFLAIPAFVIVFGIWSVFLKKFIYQFKLQKATFKLKKLRKIKPLIATDKLFLFLFSLALIFVLYLPIAVFVFFKWPYTALTLTTILLLVLFLLKIPSKLPNLFRERSYRIKLLHFILNLLIVFLLISPVYINEYKTGMDNSKEFFKALTSKSDDDKKHNLVENLFRNYQEYSKGFFLILTGSQKIDVVRLDFLKDNRLVDFKCDKVCRIRFPNTLVSFFIFTLGWILLFYNFVKIVNKKSKSSFDLKLKADLIFAIFTLCFVTFFGFLGVAYDFAPRFYLLTIIIHFVLLGFILDFIIKKNKTGLSYLICILIFAILTSLNLYFNYQRFYQQSIAHTKDAEYVKRDIILKEDIRFTRPQQEALLNWIQKNHNYNTIFVWAPPKYYRPILYHLGKTELDERRLGDDPDCFNADYFAIVKTRSKNDFFPDGSLNFESIKEEEIGSFTIHKLRIKDNPEEEDILINCKPNKPNDPRDYARRYNINEIFE
ncbi:MAG: hypothetical protein GF347_02780, partial [Candidatus Moranbacteria bacterium]|nr:hypothetical protein [Candidatus Moranbacteria bacterium]